MLRRLGLAVPLAVLVAVLVHVALFGMRHAPGGAHASELLTSLASGLALAALVCVLFAALRKRRDERAKLRFRFPSALELIPGGAAAYALIELSEGRTPLGDGIWLAALAVAAFAVSAVALPIARLLRYTGEKLAAFAVRLSAAIPQPLFVPADRPLRALGAGIAAACRGRAPPLFS